MNTIYRLRPDPNRWPPEMFDPKPVPVPKRDPWLWWAPLVMGGLLIGAGVCLGLGFAAGRAAWGWVW